MKSQCNCTATATQPKKRTVAIIGGDGGEMWIDVTAFSDNEEDKHLPEVADSKEDEHG